MLARCPACSSRFAVVGNCQLPCPFCGEVVAVSVEHWVEARVAEPAAAGNPRARGTPNSGLPARLEVSQPEVLDMPFPFRPPPEVDTVVPARGLWATLKAWWTRTPPS